MLIAFKNIIIHFCLIILISYQLVRPAEANIPGSQYPIFNSKRTNNLSDIKDTESSLNKEATNHKQNNESSDFNSEIKIKKPKNDEKNELEYLTMVYSAVMSKMIVPEQVKNIYYEGKISLILDKEGKIIKQQIYKKSGSNILDIAAMSAVKLSGPFPPPPSIKAQSLLFNYATQSKDTTKPSAAGDSDTIRQKAQEFLDKGRYQEAERLYKRDLAIREKALGSDHVDVATSLFDLGWLYYLQGRYPEAEQFEKRSLAIREKALGSDHTDVASSLNDLAVIYDSQGRYREAEPLYKRSLAIREQSLGLDHVDVAQSLNNLALLYVNQGRLQEAEPLYKRSLVIREKSLGANHIDVAQSLDNIANLYSLQGHYQESEPLYKRALAIREKILGPDHVDVASSLNDLASLYDGQGRYREAETLYKRALMIREKGLGADHPDVAWSANNLAYNYVNQGRYAEAEPLYKRALAIREKSEGLDHVDIASSLNGLGWLYYLQGRYPEAERFEKRSLAIREKALGPDHTEVASSLNDLAVIYDSQGRYREAEPLYKRSLAIREQSLGPDHVDVAQSLNNLALLYVNQDRLNEAEPLHKRSLAIREKSLGANHIDVAQSLDNIANLYSWQGRYQEAEPLHKRALAIREKSLSPDHVDVASSLSDLGLLYYNQGRYQEAESLYKRSLAIREKSLGSNHVDVASSLNDLANLYDKQGRYKEAETLYKRSLMIRENDLGSDHPDVAWSVNNLAYTYVNQGRHAEAESLYKHSLAIREKSLGPDHADVSNSLNNLASLYDLQERYEEGLPIVRRLMKEGKPDKSSVFPVLYNSKHKHLIAEQEVFNQSYNILQSTSSSAAAEAINRLAQRYAVGTSELAELVRKQQDMSAEGEKLEKMLIAAASKPIKKRNQTAESQIRNHLEEIARDKKNLTEVLIKRFPEYISLSNPQPLTLLETQKLLADDEAVVAIDIGDKHSYAWVITKTDRSWSELPTNWALLDDQVQQLRQSLTFSADKAFDTVLAYKIYQEIFGPIASKIIGKKRLSVIANGALTSLPFGLLITTEPNNKALKDMDWLIRSHALVVIPSIYSLKTMRAQATSSSAVKPMIAFADPIFSRKAHLQARSERMAMRSLSQFYQGSRLDVRSLGEYLPQLPGTRNEVQAIAKSVGADPTDIKLGLDATVTTLKQTRLDQYRIVYFATHGLVAGDLKKFSKVGAEPALVLTIPEKPTDQDNGLVQASEISELKLNADWVVLSACNTASSDGEDAEALSGLARAFLYAGARSLVVSHWDVSDEATKQLMSSLFKISAKNPQLSHGEALREATLELLDDSKTDDEAHPRMWAPFIVVGEPAAK